MIESPIRRKNLHYPKDFLPSNTRNTPQPKRFTFNQDYQIDANALKKYSQPFEQQAKVNLVTNSIPSIVPNPQKSISKQIQLFQQRPLDQHSGPKRPDIDSQILKKPRFCVKSNEEIDESQEQINAIMSPGIIKHQLEGKQAPLPLEDPCRIDLLQSSSHIKVPNSYIMYRSTAGFEGKKWSSSQKDVLERFKDSRIKKNMNQLPSVKKGQPISIGKEILQGFKKKQSSTGGALENVNNFLAALKRKQQKQQQQQTKAPKFEQKGLQKLKQDINYLAKAKRRVNFNNQSQTDRKGKEKESDDEQKYSSSQQTQKSYVKQIKNSNKKSSRRSALPQFMVSYRSSLSYLKDLYSRTSSLPSFKLTVKIPKLFTDDMIYKGQDRVDLHQTAKNIFQELKIPNQNLVIKRYTNCTMIIARNVCLIWHFDGRRYLGGWQTEYLDEGCKHGIGLQWSPKTYVYYGQFIENKKDGLGVYKDREQTIYVGYWKGGKKVQNQSQEQDQEQSQGQMDAYEDNGERYEYL